MNEPYMKNKVGGWQTVGRFPHLPLLIGLCLLFLSGCSTAARENKHYMVKMSMADSQSHFDPASLTIPPGATVTWQNSGLYPQTVTFDPAQVEKLTGQSAPDGTATWHSAILYPGEDWSYTFDAPGIYLYYSENPAMPKMIGVIEVTETP